VVNIRRRPVTSQRKLILPAAARTADIALLLACFGVKPNFVIKGGAKVHQRIGRRHRRSAGRDLFQHPAFPRPRGQRAPPPVRRAASAASSDPRARRRRGWATCRRSRRRVLPRPAFVALDVENLLGELIAFHRWSLDMTGQRSSGRRPVRFAMRASILGPISSAS